MRDINKMSQSFHDRMLIDVTEVKQQSLGHNKYEDNNYFMSAPDLFVAPKIIEEPGSKVQQSKKNEPPTESVHVWIILVAVFWFHVIMGMHFMCFGLYYVKFTEAFETTKATAGFVGSIHACTASLFSIFASVFMELYGLRLVSLAGCLMYVVGIFSSAFATNIYTLYFTYGILTGCGLSFALLCAVVVIQQHFDKHRNMATSISFVGLPCGNVVSPFIINQLLDMYGWRGTLIIHSGILLQTAICFMFFNPPELTMVAKKRENEYVEEKHHRKQQDENTKTKSTVETFFKSLVDVSVLKDPILWPFLGFIVFARILITSFFEHTPSRAVHLGSDLKSAGYLITSITAGSLVSRTIWSIVMVFVSVNPMPVLALVACGQSLVSISLPFCSTFTAVVVCTFLFGFGQGMVVPTITLIIVEIAGVNKFAKARVIGNIFGSVGSIAATPLTGWIFDVTQNYDLPFYFSGLVGLLGSLCVWVVFIMHMRRKSKAKQNSLSNNNAKEEEQGKPLHVQELTKDRTFTF